jgi:hypothetical protein
MNLSIPSRPLVRAVLVSLIGGLLFAACVEAPTSPAVGSVVASRAPEIGPMFNPQPDPPMEIREFVLEDVLIDNPNLRPWTGSWGRRDAGGPLSVELLLPAVQQGQTLRLSQSWEFGGEGVGLPAVQVDGVLNLQSGRLVLNGRDGAGKPVHIQGWMTASGGAYSIAGEVMFNPQPDPPMPQP